MTTTLTHPTAGSVALPVDLTWTDEFTWDQVTQSAEYTTTGALVLDAWAKQAGRPITLTGSETRAWCQRGVLKTLMQWASEPGKTFTLNLRGVSHSVVFNHQSGAVDATSLADYADPADDDFYVITIRFLEL